MGFPDSVIEPLTTQLLLPIPTPGTPTWPLSVKSKSDNMSAVLAYVTPASRQEFFIMVIPSWGYEGSKSLNFCSSTFSAAAIKINSFCMLPPKTQDIYLPIANESETTQGSG